MEPTGKQVGAGHFECGSAKTPFEKAIAEAVGSYYPLFYTFYAHVVNELDGMDNTVNSLGVHNSLTAICAEHMARHVAAADLPDGPPVENWLAEHFAAFRKTFDAKLIEFRAEVQQQIMTEAKGASKQ